jgi:hypothetical protein
MIRSVDAMRIAATVGSVMMFVAGGLPLASAAPMPESGPCNLQPTSNDLIIWERWPRLPDAANRVGDVDGVNCKPTLDDWKAGEPTGPGYCAKIAWASDNPGYDADARPAAPLKHVLDEVGDC